MLLGTLDGIYYEIFQQVEEQIELQKELLELAMEIKDKIIKTKCIFNATSFFN